VSIGRNRARLEPPQIGRGAARGKKAVGKTWKKGKNSGKLKLGEKSHENLGFPKRRGQRRGKRAGRKGVTHRTRGASGPGKEKGVRKRRGGLY